VFAIKEPMLAQMLSGVGLTAQQYNDFILRTQAVSESIGTNGILPIGEGGEFYAHSFTFSGLDEIAEGRIANVAAAAGIPIERWGRQGSGLNNNGEGSLQIYYDTTDQKRQHEVRPIMNKLMPIIAMSTWGMVPDDFDFEFAPIRTMTAKERGELAKAQLEPIYDAFDKGLLGRQTTLREMQSLSAENGVFTNITDEMIEEADDELLSPDLALGVDPNAEDADDGQAKGDKPAKPGIKDSMPAWMKKFMGWNRPGDAPAA
jgi:hypothetical protein